MELLPPHRPTELTEEVYKRVIDNVPLGLKITPIANLSRVPVSTLHGWLKRGRAEAEAGELSIFSRFSKDYDEALANEAKELIKGLKVNWKSRLALLKAMYREDFGDESSEDKDLQLFVETIAQKVKYLMNPMEGLNHAPQKINKQESI